MSILTIDTGALRDLWLPAERQERADLDAMDGVLRDAYDRLCPGRLSMCRACCALEREWNNTVRVITERGGLLLIGGSA